jgi:hypothetical protein
LEQLEPLLHVAVFISLMVKVPLPVIVTATVLSVVEPLMVATLFPMAMLQL